MWGLQAEWWGSQKAFNQVFSWLYPPKDWIILESNSMDPDQSSKHQHLQNWKRSLGKADFPNSNCIRISTNRWFLPPRPTEVPIGFFIPQCKKRADSKGSPNTWGKLQQVRWRSKQRQKKKKNTNNRRDNEHKENKANEPSSTRKRKIQYP